MGKLESWKACKLAGRKAKLRASKALPAGRQALKHYVLSPCRKIYE